MLRINIMFVEIQSESDVQNGLLRITLDVEEKKKVIEMV